MASCSGEADLVCSASYMHATAVETGFSGIPLKPPLTRSELSPENAEGIAKNGVVDAT